MGLMDQVFTSKHMAAKDLKQMEHTVTMESVNIVEFDKDEKDGGGKEMKLELHVVGWDKSLILNKTNATMIESFCGDDTTWPGKKIILFPTTVVFEGSTKPCIRVRQPLAMAPQSEAPATADDLPY